jgi:Tol biopolymer transport system component
VWDPATRRAAPIAGDPQPDEQWPAWSPLRPELVFAFRGGRPASGLALADATRGTRQLLATSGAREYFFRPSFAPDGRTIVAQRRGPGGRGSSLWQVRIGAAPQPLTRDPQWVDVKPVYTRDGREILYSRRARAGGPRDIVAIPADGGAPRALASTPASDDHSAQPSPRRAEFAFVSDRDGRSDVYLAPLGGGPARRLGSDDARHRYAPHWSPDGERLALISTPDRVGERGLDEPESLARIHVVVLDRAGRVLLDVPGCMPDWMPPWR